MPVLRMVRRELYAQARSRGLTQNESCIEAGYDPSDTHTNQTSNRLEYTPEVRARIDELLEEHGDTSRKALARDVEQKAMEAAVTKEEVLSGLRMVFQMAIEARPVYDKKGQEKGFTVNLAAANMSLKLMGMEVGMFVERKHLTGDNMAGMSRQQLLAAITRIDERLQSLGAPKLPEPIIIDHEQGKEVP